MSSWNLSTLYSRLICQNTTGMEHFFFWPVGRQVTILRDQYDVCWEIGDLSTCCKYVQSCCSAVAWRVIASRKWTTSFNWARCCHKLRDSSQSSAKLHKTSNLRPNTCSCTRNLIHHGEDWIYMQTGNEMSPRKKRTVRDCVIGKQGNSLESQATQG